LILLMPAKRYSLIQKFKMANEVNTFSKVYFLGIGGIGMSALARYFLQEGKKVAGYDRGDSDLTKELASEGCSICFLDDPSLIPESFMVKAEVLVVYTPAVKLDNLMLQYFMAIIKLVQKDNCNKNCEKCPLFFPSHLFLLWHTSHRDEIFTT